MDEYWKMCEKAVEIQSSKREYGDRIVLKGEEYLVGYDDLNWLENYGNGKPCKQWVCSYWVSDSPTFYGSKCIFLPTQDQLQKMVVGSYDPYCGALLSRFYKWFNKYSNFLFVSWEQLWLAFVMKQIYGRVWVAKKEIWVQSYESSEDKDG